MCSTLTAPGSLNRDGVARIDSDVFIDMPMSARLLYYDLGMRADDDGFVNSPKKIMKMIGASQDDMRILAVRKFNNTSSTERIIELIDEIDKRLDKRKIEAMQEMIKIEKFISEIVDIETRLIFSKRYIELKGWEKIGEEMHMSKRTAQQIHKKFLEGTN